MSPKAKQVLFTPQMVTAIVAAVIGAGGGTVGGFSAGSSKVEETKSIMEYRITQLEAEVKKYATFDTRLTVMEKAGDRFQGQLDRFEKMLDRQAKR